MVNRVAHLISYRGEMARPKKEPKTKLGTWISDDLFADLQRYHEQSGVPITRIVEDALDAYLNKKYVRSIMKEDEKPNRGKK